MKYPINKVVFKHKNKVGTSIAIDRYLKNLQINERVLLIGLLQSKPDFKKEFGERLIEFDTILRFLICEDKDEQVKGIESSVDFTDRSYPDNIHTVKMYKNILTWFLDYFKKKTSEQSKPNDMEALILNLKVIFNYSAIQEDINETFKLYQ